MICRAIWCHHWNPEVFANNEDRGMIIILDAHGALVNHHFKHGGWAVEPPAPEHISAALVLLEETYR